MERPTTSALVAPLALAMLAAYASTRKRARVDADTANRAPRAVRSLDDARALALADGATRVRAQGRCATCLSALGHTRHVVNARTHCALCHALGRTHQ